MNENIDLTKILKDCPKGTKLYSPIFGEVNFQEICSGDKYAIITTNNIYNPIFTKEGLYYTDTNGECTLFPSKDQRDWAKFTAPWHKKERFDPKTLQPFDKVLIRDKCERNWGCDFFSHIIDGDCIFKYVSTASAYRYCIPYNDDTKHLVGTKDEAPEYYRYWEN